MRCAYNMASELNSMHRKSRALKKARKHESERGDAPTLNLARLTRRIASRERSRSSRALEQISEAGKRARRCAYNMHRELNSTHRKS